LQDDFGFDYACDARQCGRLKRSASEVALVKQVEYQKRARKQLSEELERLKGSKVQGALRVDLMVRVGLSDPALNSRQVQEFFASDCESRISYNMVSRIRDAFCEIIKKAIVSKASALIAATPPLDKLYRVSSVVVLHLHDEASMRFRSIDRVNIEAFGTEKPSTFSRGRYSKVQNNVVRIFTSQGAVPVEWLTELQPLAKKTALALQLRFAMLSNLWSMHAAGI